MNFKEIRERGLLLFEYVRGSHLYGMATEKSDLDTGGVFIEPLESILGFIKCPEVVLDETNDTCWYSLGKYLQLLSGSNPNVLESLFVPEDKILYKHPGFDMILEKREEFLSKKCFGSFIGYAKSQLQKARNLKKKIVCPPGDKRKSILEFYFYGTPSGKTKPLTEYLSERGLDQRFIGLSKMDNMKCSYSAFYDWGGHLEILGIKTFESFLQESTDACTKQSGLVWEMLSSIGQDALYYMEEFLEVDEKKLLELWNRYKIPFKYRGITNDSETTCQVRFSSIPKGEKRLLEVSYNQDAYQRYCKVWNEWNNFKKHHNPERFNLAKEKQFDRKNAAHCSRLLEMGIEIAEGSGIILDRTGRDRDFLLSVRNGEVEYDDLMSYLEKREEVMKSAMTGSRIKDDIDPGLLHELSLGLRKLFYGIG